MDKLFLNSFLLIPAQLHKIVLREGFRPERQTAIYLIYNVIAQKCSSMKRKWTRISDLAFKNHTRKSGVKRWLEENGFITIKKWTAKDGTIKNSKIPGRRCQAYGVIEQGNESIWVELWKRKLDWPISTWSDPFCAYTREVLGKIKVDCAQVERILGGEADFSNLTSTRRLSVVHWARTLHYGSGSIRRGRLVVIVQRHRWRPKNCASFRQNPSSGYLVRLEKSRASPTPECSWAAPRQAVH